MRRQLNIKEKIKLADVLKPFIAPDNMTTLGKTKLFEEVRTQVDFPIELADVTNLLRSMDVMLKPERHAAHVKGNLSPSAILGRAIVALYEELDLETPENLLKVARLVREQKSAQQAAALQDNRKH